MKNQYKVDKGIPIPKKNYWNVKYPFQELEIGDSFFVPKSDGYKPVTVRAMASKCAKESGLKFTTRETREGLRIWRIK